MTGDPWLGLRQKFYRDCEISKINSERKFQPILIRKSGLALFWSELSVLSTKYIFYPLPRTYISVYWPKYIQFLSISLARQLIARRTIHQIVAQRRRQQYLTYRFLKRKLLPYVLNPDKLVPRSIINYLYSNYKTLPGLYNEAVTFCRIYEFEHRIPDTTIAD